MKKESPLDIKALAQGAKTASRVLALAPSSRKDRALQRIAEALEQRVPEIVAQNRQDMAAGREKGLSEALLDRLLLAEERVKGMADGVRELASFPDPIGEIVGGRRTREGLELEQRRVPLGVVAVIYEARPNVTVDAAALCVKTGNSIILRGGGDAFLSNQVLSEIVAEAVYAAELPKECIGFVASKDRAVLGDLLGLTESVDLVIPRGGEKLKQFLVEKAKVPVIYAAGGNCHVYVDAGADLDQAVKIAVNAKVDRPGVCNSAETLLVHSSVAQDFLPLVVDELRANGVKLYVDEETKAVLRVEQVEQVESAQEVHYATEFLALEMAVGVVGSLEEAVQHITRYGTGHSEAIVTQDLEASRTFVDAVDAAAVYVNASTRFTDGAVYGLGAEIGISTQKLHARGPMGVRELTSTKYVVKGRGHVR